MFESFTRTEIETSGARIHLRHGRESGIGREFSLEGMLESSTQGKNVTVNLNTPRRV
jgi:hypothetical protein